MSPNQLLKKTAVLATLWVSVTLHGCYTRLPISVGHARPVSDPKAASFELSLTVEPVKVTLGDQTTLKISIHNPYPHHLEMHFPSGCNVDFQVWDSKGRSVGPFRACNAFRSSISLDAYETRVVTRQWPPDGYHYSATDMILPGRYWITVGFVWGVEYEPVTDAVMIEIVPPMTDW